MPQLDGALRNYDSNKRKNMGNLLQTTCCCCGPREVRIRKDVNAVLQDLEELTWEEYDHLVRVIHDGDADAKGRCMTYCCALP